MVLNVEEQRESEVSVFCRSAAALVSCVALHIMKPHKGKQLYTSPQAEAHLRSRITHSAEK